MKLKRKIKTFERHLIMYYRIFLDIVEVPCTHYFLLNFALFFQPLCV